MLEMIDKGSATESHPVPLLFVHGAWHAAWCWDEHFLAFFADRGYACCAPSLRGHGASPGKERLRWTGIEDYVGDVAATAAQLPTKPVLIGHSMGGFVIQKYLEHHTAAGAILVATIPPTGVLRVTLYIARRYPAPFLKVHASLRLAPLVGTPELVRDLLFCASTPDSNVETCRRRVQDESYRAFLDMLALDLVKTKHVNRVPMLVLGAEHDAIVSERQIRRTAAVYGADAQIFPDMGHDMMLEPGWRAVAERIDGWLAGQGF
ncbi:alpha/beta hydrolase [Mycobacterium lacus]|uniref:Alpha/beta hydrolase n=1 Tax=Mycobacterium lacus TaxID=169765 RepID=A0A1X1XY42_9MYCO|nr:alpha/beta fold hydrolase [Mycobacterium lacus]MCV7123831.1 alpha/beta fold hydrolase [Mycobacterium lacus]ORW03691.1 alpha/beta hydrolase [Mycobacterium lacus]BBX95653.1 alpha/beta hydrolase [Mycobacterium lacus]